MDEQRRLLDQLLGPNRNGDNISQLQFTDPQVCKNHLCGLCPHELFVNTKMDLGECPKVHATNLKEDYEAASTKAEYGYEREMFVELERLLDECDRKIQRAQKRIDATQQPDDNAIKINKEIQELQARAERAGESGNVDESMELLRRAEELRQQLLGVTNGSGPNETTQQKLRVCDVCGAYLSLFDSDRRLADHFGGKMHIGYMKIREKVKELKEKYSRARRLPAPPPTVSSAYRDNKNRERERDKDKDRDRNRDRDRDYHRRSRERERDYRRDRERTHRNRERDHERDRDYRRDHEHRDRDKHRDRDRDRDRERENDKPKSEDRDKDRERSNSNKEFSDENSNNAPSVGDSVNHDSSEVAKNNREGISLNNDNNQQYSSTGDLAPEPGEIN